MHLTAPKYAVKIIGGIRPLARVAKRNPKSVMRWLKWGRIPTVPRLLILKYAQKNKLPLTSDDLDLGRTVRQ